MLAGHQWLMPVPSYWEAENRRVSLLFEGQQFEASPDE
jgi:hypothetical protein